MHLRRDDGGGGGASGRGRGCTTNSGRTRAGFSLCINAISIDVVVGCFAVSIAENTEGSCYALVRHFALSMTLSLSLSCCRFSLLPAFCSLLPSIVAPFLTGTRTSIVFYFLVSY